MRHIPCPNLHRHESRLFRGWILALLPLVLTCGLLAACGGGGTPSGDMASKTGADQDIEPVQSHDNGAPPAATGKPGPIGFDLPEGWQAQPTTSAMRTSQATIPGDAGPGEMAVFYFGPGQGGGVEDNLQRWEGQVQEAQDMQPERDSFQVADLTVTYIGVHGTLMPSGMGSGPSSPQPDSMLMGAVVEGPGGPWFIKVVGPEATLEPQRDAFLRMLHSVRPPA